MTQKWVSSSKKRPRRKRRTAGGDPLKDPLGVFDERETRIFEGERRVAAEILNATEDAAGVLNAAGNALAFGEEFRRHHLKVFEPSREIACHEGCHWCCYVKVAATAPEVLLLAAYIEENAPPDILDTIKKNAAELSKDERIFSEDAKAEARIPCVLLTDAGTCAAYEVRPLACRGWNSMNPESCKRGLDDKKELGLTNIQLVRECAAVGLGLLAAIQDSGMPADVVELTSGLHIALSEPRALERWVIGEPIFASALSDRSP